MSPGSCWAAEGGGAGGALRCARIAGAPPLAGGAVGVEDGGTGVGMGKCAPWPVHAMVSVGWRRASGHRVGSTGGGDVGARFRTGIGCVCRRLHGSRCRFGWHERRRKSRRNGRRGWVVAGLPGVDEACGMGASPPLGAWIISTPGADRVGVAAVNPMRCAPLPLPLAVPSGHGIQTSSGSVECPGFGHPCLGLKGVAGAGLPQTEGRSLGAGK